MEMVTKEITDRQGRKFLWMDIDNGITGTFKELADKNMRPGDVEQNFLDVKMLEMRDDDVMICTYSRAGTHWVWEIASMVLKEAAVYEKFPKERFMLGMQSPSKLAELPSPRLLNGHQLPQHLPDQIFSKKVKVIHVYRNPKDVAVSLFYFTKKIPMLLPAMENKPWDTFSEFLPYFTGEYGVFFMTSIFVYYKEMQKFIKSHPEQTLNLCYEEMKKDPVAAVEQIAKFLNKDLSKDLIREIADKCSFTNLVAAVQNLKEDASVTALANQLKFETSATYRKGEVGDWKNHFTVAENEQFDKLLEEQFKDFDWNFFYTL